MSDSPVAVGRSEQIDETWPRQRALPHYYWMDQAPVRVGAGMPGGR
ncbi:MAG: hypothetical protein HOB12_05900 [Gemmatimonadales bacterium]|nr:hypothetical protein [Gemmatimonadales bacterium]